MKLAKLKKISKSSKLKGGLGLVFDKSSIYQKYKKTRYLQSELEFDIVSEKTFIFGLGIYSKTQRRQFFADIPGLVSVSQCHL